MSAGRCADCGTEMVPGRARQPNSHAGRGLCLRCYDRHKCRGTLADFPRRSWPGDELLAEWEWLRDSGETVLTAAARLRITPVALDRALHRALARGDQRGKHNGCCRSAKAGAA